jgi:hypothetical protein
MKNAVALAMLLFSSCGGFAQSAGNLQLATRYGTFTLGEDQTLLFHGHPLQPPVQGNNGLDIGTPFHIGESDVVLVTILAGTACPYLYHFITVTRSGAKSTPAFGTCNEAMNLRRSGDSILLEMHGYRGPFEREADRRKAARGIHRFVFQGGRVTKDGRAAK